MVSEVRYAEQLRMAMSLGHLESIEFARLTIGLQSLAYGSVMFGVRYSTSALRKTSPAQPAIPAEHLLINRAACLEFLTCYTSTIWQDSEQWRRKWPSQHDRFGS